MEESKKQEPDVPYEEKTTGQYPATEEERQEKIPGSIFLSTQEQNGTTPQNRLMVTTSQEDKTFESFLYETILDLLPGEPLPKTVFKAFKLPNLAAMFKVDEPLQQQMPNIIKYAILMERFAKADHTLALDETVYRIIHDIPILSSEPIASRPGYETELESIRRAMPDLSEKMSEILGRPVHLTPLKYFYATIAENPEFCDFSPGTGTDSDFKRYMLDRVSEIKPGEPLPKIVYFRQAYNPEQNMGMWLEKPETEECALEMLTFVGKHSTPENMVNSDKLVYGLEQDIDPLKPIEPRSAEELEYMLHSLLYSISTPDITAKIEAARVALSQEDRPKVQHVPSIDSPKKGRSI